MAKIDDMFKIETPIKNPFSTYLDTIHIITEPYERISNMLKNVFPSENPVFRSIANELKLISNMYEPIINSFTFKIDNYIPNFSMLLQDISTSIKTIDYDECTCEEQQIIDSSVSQIKVLEEVNLSHPKKLTWEQWVLIITTFMQLISSIKDWLPNEQLEELTEQVSSIATTFDSYVQQSLENQALSLEKQDKMIENQEILIDLLQQNQQNQQNTD